MPILLSNHPSLWFSHYPWPRAEDNKYTRGHAVIVGGEEMTGAARLAARAARRAGAGLITIACSEKTFPIYAGDAPGHLVQVFSDLEEWESLIEDPRKNAVLIGVGLLPDSQTRERVLNTLQSSKKVILDGGALTAFEKEPEELFEALKGREVILTPHEGEFKKLFKEAPVAFKTEQALWAAHKSHAIIVFKGSDTVIANPHTQQVYVQEKSSPWLATAGTGDVLAGLILGFVAQGVEPFQAAAMGVWCHSKGAEEAGPGLIAEDLADHLPKVIRRLREERQVISS